MTRHARTTHLVVLETRALQGDETLERARLALGGQRVHVVVGGELGDGHGEHLLATAHNGGAREHKRVRLRVGQRLSRLLRRDEGW